MNIMHPTDPFAYRFEPLLHASFGEFPAAQMKSRANSSTVDDRSYMCMCMCVCVCVYKAFYRYTFYGLLYVYILHSKAFYMYTFPRQLLHC